jgi:CHAD domain-containing protein
VLAAGHVRAAIRAQIATALAQLSRRELSDQDVHAARKCIKKARAALRLMREFLGTATYRHENEALRDAARPLSAARDAKILIEALDALIAKRAIDARSAAALRQALVSERTRVQRRAASRNAVILSRRTLRAVHRRALRWSLREGEPALIVRALKRVYRRARRAMSKARTERSAEYLHEWRKQVKYLWHQLQMLEPLQVHEIRERSDQLHKLSDHLGNDHDLSVLREKVLARPGVISRSASRALLRAVEKRRASLQQKAFALGRRLFSDRPSEFVQRFVKT